MRAFWLLLIVTLISACSPTPSPPTPASPSPAPTVTRVSSTARASPTEPAPAATELPAPTVIPTRQPSEEFWSKLHDEQLTSASIAGPDGLIYTFYQLSAITRPGLCRLSLFRWDGQVHTQFFTFEEATACEATAWDEIPLTPDERQALGAQGYWSDINQNGRPELTLAHYSDCYSCDKANSGHYAVYEIHEDGTVTNIVNELRLEIWSGQIVHSETPLTIYMTEYVRFDVHCFIDIEWVYQWDGAQFVNVSRSYAHEYQEQIDLAVARLQELYGKALTALEIEDMLRILVLNNSMDFPQQAGLESFLEVTQPDHWPGTEQPLHCWLQLARAYAQVNYEQGRPFRIEGITGVYLYRGELTELTRDIDTARFDVSACQ